MKFDSCDFILSYIELRITPPLSDPSYRVETQIVTLTADATMGDTNIYIDFLSENFKKDTTFYNHDFLFTLARDHEVGETSLEVYPLMDDLSNGDIFKSVNLQQVFSINSLETTVDSQELSDRVVGKSIWTTNRITNRIYNIVVSGVKINNDLGLRLVKDSVKTTKPIYFELWVEDNPILPVRGLAYVKKLNEQNLIDNNIEISFELVIFKLGEIEKLLVYTIASEEFDAIIGEEGVKNYFLLPQ